MLVAAQFPRFHMALWAGIAVAWVILGANSGNVPWGTDTFWLVACGLTAGAALGVAKRGTRNSMCVYLAAATAIASIRAIAYLADGGGSPAWVWLIVTLTNVVLLGHWRTTNAR